MRAKRLHADREYTQHMLPQNRKEVFWDVVKLHWRTLLNMGFIVLLFAAPLYILLWMQDGQKVSVQTLPEEQLQEAYYRLATANNIRSFLSILFWALLGVGLAGLCRVLRQYAWEENVHLYTDFVKGIRDNGKHTVLICLIVGTACAICTATYNMLPYGGSVLSWVSLIQIGVSVIVVLPVCGLCLTMIPIYSNMLKQHILFSLAVYLKTLLKTLIVAILCALIVLPLLIPVVLSHVLGTFLVSFLAPFVLLAWTLYSYQVFDTHINTHYYPELVGKGILGNEVQQDPASEDQPQENS